jgi:aminoglycoside phosphotransferase (APT) family kinase protein
MLSNRDISATNILIHPATHTLYALIDWEYVALLPPSLACQIPSFLTSPARTEPPAYKPPEDSNDVYRKNLATYEKMCL